MGQMRIEAFQIAAGGQWRRRLRLMVVAVSLVSSWVITAGSLERAAAEKHQSVGINHLVYAVLIGFIAAYLAMLLRDLAAIIESRRRQA